MTERPSLIYRIAIGKGVGFVIGLIGLIVIPYLWPDSSWIERFGFLFWYTTVGAVIGMFGVFTQHPILHLPMPWWVRSSVIGAWMNFVLVLLMYDRLTEMMEQLAGVGGAFASPFWFVLEGAIVGMIIGYVTTHFAGEGAETVLADSSL